MLISKKLVTSKKYLNVVMKSRESLNARFLLILVATFLSLLLLPNVYAATVFRPDLSDRFNNSNLNTTLWTTGQYKPIVYGCTTYDQTETTFYHQGVTVNDYSINNVIMTAWTNSKASYKATPFDTYDIYMNFTAEGFTGGGAGGTQMGVIFVNETTNQATAPVWLLYFFKSPQTNKIWHIRVDNGAGTIKSYNQDGSVNTTITAKGVNWSIGWYSNQYSGGDNDYSCRGEYALNIYNYSVYQTTVPLTESTVTYDASVYETASQTIVSNIYWDNNTYNDVNAILYYEGTPYSTTKTKSGNTATFTTVLDTPAVTANDVLSFNFTYSLNGVSYSAPAHTQNVLNTNFTECSATNTVAFLNFTTFEEGTLLELNSSVELSLAYWLGGGTTYDVLSYNNLNNNQSRFNFCFQPSTSTIKVTGVADYYYIQPVTNLTYSRRSHYFDNATLSNVNTYIPLYMLTENSSTLFTFTVIDENSNNVEGAFINVLRWDIGTNNFYTVDAVKTNALGQGTAQIRLNDAWYVFEVIYNGHLVLTTDPEIETTNAKTLVINVVQPSIYASFGDIDYDLAYNNNTHVFEFTYADTTGKVTIGCLQVVNVGADNQTYFDCVYSNAGTLAYPLTENGTYVANAIFTINVNNITASNVVETMMVTLGIPARFAVIGTYGRVAAVLLIGTLAMIGVASGSIILASFLIIAGIVVSYLLGLVYFSPLVMYSIVAVIIVLLVLARRRLG